MGRSIFELYADRPAFLHHVRRALAGEALVAADETRGGVFERCLEPIFDAQGQVAGVVGVSLDITERHRAETELRASQALLRTVVDSLPQFIWAKDRDGRCLIANRAMAEAHGLTPAEMRGRHVLDLPGVSDTIREQHRALDHGVLDDGRAVDAAEFRLTGPGGEERCLRVHKRPLLGPDRDVIGLVGIAEDVTEQQRIQAELERGRALLQAIFDTFPARIMVTGRDGQALLVNRVFADEANLAPGESALPNGDAPPRPAAERQRIQDELLAVVREGRSFDSECQRRRPDGTEVSERVIRVPLYDRTGSIDGALSIALDITAQKAAEAQLRQAQKMEAVGQLAGGVAHDFNNLLQVILGHGEIAARAAKDQPKLAQSLARLMGAAERGGELTRKLLAFGRRQVPQPRDLRLDERVDDLVRMLGRLLGAHIELRQEHPPGGVCVHADPGLLDQVLMNLCINARDAMPAGGVLTLRSEGLVLDEPQSRAQGLEAAGRYVRLAVTDTGEGMAPEVLPHIFEPFYTTKPEGQGTGLGLSTVYRIVHQHGGAIHVNSVPGRGTTFSVLLPACDKEAPLRPWDGPSSIPRGSETVLVVQLEADARGLLPELLQTQGYRVLTADSDSEAKQQVRAQEAEIALVLVDLRTPSSDSRALLRLLRDAVPAASILLSTGYLAEPADLAFVREHGLSVIEKPYSPYELFRKVWGLVDAGRLEDAP